MIDESIDESLVDTAIKRCIVKSKEEIVCFINDDHRRPSYADSRFCDKQVCNSAPSINLVNVITYLFAEAHRKACFGAERLGEFALARSRGTVKEYVRALLV